jgi:hypothetical protein
VKQAESEIVGYRFSSHIKVRRGKEGTRDEADWMSSQWLIAPTDTGVISPAIDYDEVSAPLQMAGW